jgi:hypothetical protein
MLSFETARTRSLQTRYCPYSKKDSIEPISQTSVEVRQGAGSIHDVPTLGIKAESMKPGHAAALALVGWYLMVPPLSPDRTHNNQAPISQWTIFDSFDTAAECSDSLLRQYDRTERKHNQTLADAYSSAASISTDDPRLKAK